MPTIVSKSSLPCEFCDRTIPAGTEIAYESKRGWHTACHEAAVNTKKLARTVRDALRAAGLEAQAEAADASHAKAGAVVEACRLADEALDKAGPRASEAVISDARAAVAALRAAVPRAATSANADRALAAKLLAGEIERIRRGD